MTAFQLGIEQGRRLERPKTYEHHILSGILNKQTERLKSLEIELVKHDPLFVSSSKEVVSLESEEEFIID